MEGLAKSPRCCAMWTYADLVTVVAQHMRSCNALKKRCSKAPNNNERPGASGGDPGQVVGRGGYKRRTEGDISRGME